MSHLNEYTTPAVYLVGRYARINHKRKTPPATLTWADQHWWLAGWNDADREEKSCAA
jgi:hypothetical protein